MTLPKFISSRPTLLGKTGNGKVRGTGRNTTLCVYHKPQDYGRRVKLICFFLHLVFLPSSVSRTTVILQWNGWDITDDDLDKKTLYYLWLKNVDDLRLYAILIVLCWGLTMSVSHSIVHHSMLKVQTSSPLYQI